MKHFLSAVTVALLLLTGCSNSTQPGTPIPPKADWIVIDQPNFTANYPATWKPSAGNAEDVISPLGFRLNGTADTAVQSLLLLLRIRHREQSTLEQEVKEMRTDILQMQKGEDLQEHEIDYGPSKGYSFTYCTKMEGDVTERYEVSLWLVGSDLYEGAYIYSNKMFYTHVKDSLFEKQLPEARGILNSIKVKAPLPEKYWEM